MKRVENLTKNKVLINTFNKLKVSFYLNKQFSKKLIFFLLKYRFSKIFITTFNTKIIFLKNTKKNLNPLAKTNRGVHLYKILTMFIYIYIY